MCGISGIIYNRTSKNTEKFKSSANLQSHRGPDYTGYYGDEHSDFIHHRLSILDLDSRSNQPFTDQNKNNYLIYNGEIYNYKDLIKQYDLKVTTTSDTEVLFQLVSDQTFDYKELNGIYAFAFYNKMQGQLKLVRDKLGVKPLYYYQGKDYFIFSSEAKVIYSYLDELKLDYQVLSEYLAFSHSNGLNTIVSGVKKLNPGSTLQLDVNTFEVEHHQFWKLEEEVKHQIKPTYVDAKKHTTKLLEEAMQRQCISDVPVGAYLSGGIDSSAVVAMASKYTDKKLLTYSVDFDKNPHSELKAATKIAKRYGTEHHEFQVNLDNVEEYLTKLIYQYDEPFADPAMIPLHLIAEKAKHSSTVVLQGDGGDEIFAGYGRHLDFRQFRERKLIFKTLKNFHFDKSKRKHFKTRFESLNYDNKVELMANMVPINSDVDYDRFFAHEKADVLKMAKPFQLYEESYNRYKDYPLMQTMLYTDMENILPHKFLEKVDKVNMWHSIEARVPLLDDKLVDYVMRLPHSYKIRKGITKYFLRDILKDYLPDEILNDRKRSFGTPVIEWLRTTLYEFTLDIFEKADQQKYPINYKYLIYSLQEFRKGNAIEDGHLLWKFLVLTIWMNCYKEKIIF